jgi:hypothetical protein
LAGDRRIGCEFQISKEKATEINSLDIAAVGLVIKKVPILDLTHLAL